MTTLRNPFSITTDDNQARLIAEQARADDMWAPTRGYVAGRIGTDINAALADEASLRAAGDLQGADVAARRALELQQRQALYAPRVGRVEDIGGVGDFMSWAGTQVGQGVASMQDPVAIATLGQGVGTALRAIPALRGVSRLAPVAGAAGAFAYNQRQGTGEMYGRLKDDPEALAGMSAQDANRMANTYGLAAGALDTLVPVAAGRALGGRALLRDTQAGRALLGNAGMGTRTVAGMVGEGTTEMGQQMLQQGAHSLANPLRDTSGDFSENLNAFAGGAVGGAPFAAAGAAADSVYGRVGDGAQRVTERAGEAVDLLKERGSQAADQVRSRIGDTIDLAKERAPDLMERSGLKAVFDLGTEKGKPVWDKAKEALAKTNDYIRDSQGRVNFPEALERARQDVERYRLSSEEFSMLTETPPEGAVGDELAQWFMDHDARTIGPVTDRMVELENSGVPEASRILDGLTSDDPLERSNALQEATEFLLSRNEAAQAHQKAVAMRAVFGTAIQRGVAGAARAAKTAAAGAAKGAAFVTENAVEGVRQASKKNLQGTADDGLTHDAWERWTIKNEGGHAVASAVKSNDPEYSRSKQRAITHGEMLAAEVGRDLGDADDTLGLQDFARSLAFEVNRIANALAFDGVQPPPRVLDAIARDFRGLFRERTAEVIARLTQTANPRGREVYRQLQDRAEGWAKGRSARVRENQALVDKLLLLLPAQQQRELRSDPKAAEDMLDMFSEIARGRVSPERRREVERALGAETFRGMLAAYNEHAIDNAPRADIQAELGQTVDDSGAVEAGELVVGDDGDASIGGVDPELGSDFAKRQGERSVASRAGPPTYNFARSALQSGRTPTARDADPFAPNEKGKRPELFRYDLKQDTAIGRRALVKKMRDLMALHEGVSGAMAVRARSLAEVFKELNYSEQQRLALYRDYLRQERLTDDADRKAEFVQAMLDGRYTNAVGQAKIRKALKEFAGQRFVVATEQGTERVPTEMSSAALLSMGKGGDKAVSAIRKEAMAAGKRGTPAYEAAFNKAMSEANMLIFQGTDEKNLMGRTSAQKDIYIPADRLVKWVRARMGDVERDGKAHELYLQDLLDGITSVVTSGYTDGKLPAMVDANGTMHSFSDRLPPNLRLGLRKVSSIQADPETVAKLDAERAARVAAIPATQPDVTADGDVILGGDARRDRVHQERVANEQDRDFYTPSDEGEDGKTPRTKTVYTRRRTEDGRPVISKEVRTLTDYTTDPLTGRAVPAEDLRTPLDATRDERFGNFKTEREDLADRTPRKATDLSPPRKGELERAAAETAKTRALRKAEKEREHAVAQRVREKKERQAKATEAPKAEAPKDTPKFTPKQAAMAIYKEDYSAIKTDEDADQFLAMAPKVYAQLQALSRKAEQEGRDLSNELDTVRLFLRDALKPGSTFDWASLYPSWELGSNEDFDARVAKALGWNAAPGVAAQDPKSQPKPAGEALRNAQATTGSPASDAAVAKAKAYLDRVLGSQIKAEFKEITGYSGEWIDQDNLLRVSTLTNAGIMDVTRHEALHAFFSKFIKGNPKAARVLASLTDDPRIVRRLEVLLKDEPEALKQLADGEERLAYIYQFAMAGRLRLPASQGKTLMGKIRKFLRRVFQMVSDQERAADLLYAFEAGKMRDPSAAGRAIAATINQGTWLSRGSRAMGAITQKAAALIQPASTILAVSPSQTARRIGELFYTNPGEEKDGQREPGYLNARNQQMRRYENVYRGIIEGLDGRQLGELITAMQRETPVESVTDPDVAAAKEKLHAFFERMYRYMRDEKGLRVRKIRENYFPRVYDKDALMNKPAKFTGMLLEKYASELQEMAARWNEAQDRRYAEMDAKEAAAAPPKVVYTPKAVADELLRRIIGADGVDDEVLSTPLREDGVLRPWMSAGEERKLNFIKPEDIEPFLEKDLFRTLGRYVRQAVRTAEYSARFGRTGARLHTMLMDVSKELEAASHDMLKHGDLKDEKARKKWVEQEYRNVANAVGAMEGSLGNDVSNTVRQLNSWGVVYQNVRLLPLALFSSFVDPLGIIARGGEMREAYEAFVRGIKSVGQQWADMIRDEPAQRKKDRWEHLAEIAGVVDGTIFTNMLHDEYGSVYHTGGARKINEAMFKANGMEAWNRAMRVSATRAAVGFIERHSQGVDKHSARWMRELGLTEDDLYFDDDGNLITDKRTLMNSYPDMDMEVAEQVISKTHSAILRWVEGAILSPNAAQRPAWASDPHYGVFWHLKQFAYSFHETIMKRAVNEVQHGNALPLGVFAWYIPVMIASDVVKGLATGAGDLPNYMKGYDLGDWVQHGVDRSGVLGKYHLLIDGINDPAGVPGPLFDQVVDIVTEPTTKTLIDALPAHALYERMF